MDGFKRIHPSSSPSTKSSVIPKLSSPDLQSRTCYSREVGKVNENEQNAHQMGSKMQSPKNFMSPTISTASKAASAKKILGERNDLNRYTPKNSFKVSETDQEENISAADPSSQPYDPLTNYLSPRPKFLRYKPNRRIEFLLHRESEREKHPESIEQEEESSQSVDADGSSLSSSFSSVDGSLEQKDGSSLGKDYMGSRPSANEENNNSEDDDEKEMEELDANERHWHFNKVFKFLILLGILIFSTIYISSMNSPTSPPSYIESLQEVKRGEYLFQVTVVNIALSSNFLNQENYLGINNENDTVNAMGIQGENFHQVAENLELQQSEGEAHSMVDSQAQFMTHWVENQSAGSDIFSNFEIEISLDKEGVEPVKAEEEKGEAFTEASGGAADKRTLKHEIELCKERVNKWWEEVENRRVSQAQLILGEKATEHTDSEINNTSVTEVDLEEEDQIKPMESEFIARAAVVVSLIAISMVFGLLHLKKRKIIKASELRVQSSSESVVVEKRRPELSPSESMAKGDSLVCLSTSESVHSKASKDLRQSGLPKVEFPGEFTVGEISSSIKSCALKSKKVEGEEQSNFSTSQGKRPRRKTPSYVNGVHLSLSEFSASESASYGSFTAQENIVKKEEGNDGEEVKKMVNTPVRRSNRIRSRGVMSP